MKSKKNENIIAIIMYIIIFLAIIGILYLVFKSNINLLNNDSIENDSNQNTNNTSQINNNNQTTNNISSNVKTEKYKNNDDNINTSKEKTNQGLDQEEKDPPPIKEEQFATYTTTLYDKEKTRIENINLAISKLNGVIIENSAEFSFNNTIGPMDESNGFKKATGFDSKGRKIKISGGGICQISSTIYNTALIAGFEITERHPHSRRVYYVPKDKDATIFYGSLDLKFINNSGSKIRIDASATDSTVTISLIKIS